MIFRTQTAYSIFLAGWFLLIGTLAGVRPAVAQPSVGVIVMPFRINAPADLAYLSGEIPEALRQQFEEEGANARVLEPETAEAWAKTGETDADLARLALQTGADYVVRGSLTWIGQNFSVDARKKFIALLLETVGIAAQSGASASGLHRDVEEQRQVRPQIALHPVLDRRYPRRRNAAAASLVGIGGIGKAIAQHDLAGVQCRTNHAGDVLGARREHQQHFAFGGDVQLAAMQQDIADAFTEFGAAGFARHHDFAPRTLQPIPDESQVGALPGSLSTFQRDEYSSWHNILPACRGSGRLVARYRSPRLSFQLVFDHGLVVFFQRSGKIVAAIAASDKIQGSGNHRMHHGL